MTSVQVQDETDLLYHFRCRDLQQSYHYSITIVQELVAMFVVTNFFLATFMDPGTIPKGKIDGQEYQLSAN